MLIANDAIGADALGLVAPPAEALRESVIAGAALPEMSAPRTSVTLCRRWQRPARVAVRLLERRRELARRWRVENHSRGRVAVARARRCATSVFSVPIVDGNGATLEEHVIGVRVPAAGDQGVDSVVVEAARDAARRSLATHLARVRRWHHRQHHAAASRERAIAQALASDLRIEQLQPGLFDRRAMHAFESSQQVADDVRADDESWIAEHEDTLPIEIGRPHLAVLLLEI